MEHYDIFISYKRKSLPTANNLYYRLTTRGYSAFFDLEDMGRDNFNIQLHDYIENSKDVFVILEEGSLDACRTDNWKKDWFCHEIAFALANKKNIIPILIGGYQMPSVEFFPDELKDLSFKYAPQFSFEYFDAYLDKLIDKNYLISKPNTLGKTSSVFKFYSNENCSIFKEGKLVCTLEGLSDEPFYLPVSRKGDYRFKVIKVSTGETMIIDEKIDAVEEKTVDITWKPGEESTEYDVFISYSRHDYLDDHENVIPNNEISKIMDALTNAGITYWIDKKGIYSGDKFTEELPKIIKSAPIFVYLSTANANKSKYTSKEIAIADEYGKYIIPVRLDMTPYSDKVIFRIADVSFIKYAVNPAKGREDLVKSIKAFLKKKKENMSHKKEKELLRKEENGKMELTIEEVREKIASLREILGLLSSTLKEMAEREPHLDRSKGENGLEEVRVQIIESNAFALDKLKEVGPILNRADRDILLGRSKDIEKRRGKLQEKMIVPGEMTDVDYKFFTDLMVDEVELKHDFKKVLEKEIAKISGSIRTLIDTYMM